MFPGYFDDPPGLLPCFMGFSGPPAACVLPQHSRFLYLRSPFMLVVGPSIKALPQLQMVVSLSPFLLRFFMFLLRFFFPSLLPFQCLNFLTWSLHFLQILVPWQRHMEQHHPVQCMSQAPSLTTCVVKGRVTKMKKALHPPEGSCWRPFWQAGIYFEAFCSAANYHNNGSIMNQSS